MHAATWWKHTIPVERDPLPVMPISDAEQLPQLKPQNSRRSRKAAVTKKELSPGISSNNVKGRQSDAILVSTADSYSLPGGF